MKNLKTISIKWFNDNLNFDHKVIRQIQFAIGLLILNILFAISCFFFVRGENLQTNRELAIDSGNVDLNTEIDSPKVNQVMHSNLKEADLRKKTDGQINALGEKQNYAIRFLIGSVLIFSAISLKFLVSLRSYVLGLRGDIRNLNTEVENYRQNFQPISLQMQTPSSELELLSENLNLLTKDVEKSKFDFLNMLKEKNEALTNATNTAETAKAAKNQFLAVMSHELRTPLSGISSYIELLKLTELDKAQLQDLKGIEHCANSLLHIIEEILDFSKLEVESVELESDLIFLPALLGNIRQRVEKLTLEKNQTFILHADVNLPEVIIGDAKNLEHLLLNLLRNAVKFSSSGSGVVLIAKSISGENDLKNVQFIVSDSGQGISKNKQELIFDPFRQGEDSLTRNFGGIGLGLSISHRLASLMRGKIEVKSKENVGTSFLCTLPLEVPILTSNL